MNCPAPRGGVSDLSNLDTLAASGGELDPKRFNLGSTAAIECAVPRFHWNASSAAIGCQPVISASEDALVTLLKAYSMEIVEYVEILLFVGRRHGW